MIMLSNNILHQGLQLWIELYQWNGTERSYNKLHKGRSVTMKVAFHSYVGPTLTLNHLLFIMGILYLKSWVLYWNSTQKPPLPPPQKRLPLVADVSDLYSRCPRECVTLDIITPLHGSLDMTAMAHNKSTTIIQSQGSDMSFRNRIGRPHITAVINGNIYMGLMQLSLTVLWRCVNS